MSRRFNRLFRRIRFEILENRELLAVVLQTAEYNGNQYHLLSGPNGSGLTWTQAHEAVRDYGAGASLITLRDEAERSFIANAFKQSAYVWTGFTDVANEGDFRGPNGEMVRPDLWWSGEPSNGAPGEHFALLYNFAGGGFRLNDYSDSGTISGWPVHAVVVVDQSVKQGFATRFVYLVPSDRQPSPAYRSALETTAKTVQRWYADKMGDPGFAATYRDAQSGNIVSRIDRAVNFYWDAASPAGGIGNDNFTAKWTTHLHPPTSGTFTFYVRSDDGIRLYIDGRLVIDSWYDRAISESSASIELTDDHIYDITLEYYERTGGAIVDLSWSGPSFDRQILAEPYVYAGNGKTVVLNTPAVETYVTEHPASWYSTNPPGSPTEMWFWQNVLGDGFALTGEKFDDPNNRWIFYIDAAPACRQLIGGTNGVALMARNDLEGLTGGRNVPTCANESPDLGGIDRWIIGAAHEIGHALGLAHPGECRPDGPLAAREAMMCYGYMDGLRATLTAEDKSSLNNSPFTRERPLDLTENIPALLSEAQSIEGTNDVVDAFQWHNRNKPEDVNGDQAVTPNDALVVINNLNLEGARQLAAEGSVNAGYRIDVTNDWYISPVDALTIINLLNSLASTQAEGEPDLMSMGALTVALVFGDEETFVEVREEPLLRQSNAVAFDHISQIRKPQRQSPETPENNHSDASRTVDDLFAVCETIPWWHDEQSDALAGSLHPKDSA
jgi:hypothetical protein